MDKKILTTAVISAVSGGIAGGIITYITVNKRLVTRYEEWANSEIDSVKARYALLHKDEEGLNFVQLAQNPSPEMIEAMEKGRDLIRQMGYSPIEQEEVPEGDNEAEDEPSTRDIFDLKVEPEEYDPELGNKGGGDPDYEPSEEELHGPAYVVIEGEPFKITEDEYFQNDPGYSLDTLTYYEVDETLTDEHNSQIDRVEETIGSRHLHMFGHDRDNTKNSIYIQNDDHQTLYEIISINGSYAAMVLGMTEEELGLKPEKQRPKKMKKDVD